MPVEGHKLKRVWQYSFRPQPYRCLDRAWGHDYRWEYEVIERIRNGLAAPRTFGSVYDLFPAEGMCGDASWEVAEKHSKNADRRNAAFLNDEAIALRVAERARVKQAHKESWAARAVWEAEERARRAAAETAARKEAQERREKEWARRREAEVAAFAQREAARNEKLEERRAEQARLDAIFQHDRDVRAILYAKWLCIDCNNVAMVEQENDGYVFTCLHCRKIVRGSHEQVMAARSQK